MIMRSFSLFACLTIVAAIGAVDKSAAATRPPVSYDRDIRPILSDKCYHCHGPDAASREAELRLDTRDGLAKKVVVAGKPDKSELIRRIFSDDDDERMPPVDSKITLSAEQKELLHRWVAEGAKFAEHWSFQPLRDKVAVPQVRETSWLQQPIDNFVLARLESEKLRPTRPADALRLLRRATLDLTGLPPASNQCREFEKVDINDKEFDTIYSRAVDRLLASPAFGEHLAVGWLDAARYADSYGYQSDQLNTQWPYRDWVVKAFNANMPYDQFLTTQLAGDLLEHPTRDQILATAFNRLHRLTNEGGSIAEEWMNENAADRVQTFGTAMLGLTVECARCHDHKYDPITARDYYSLSAFFNSIDESGMYDRTDKVPTPSLLLPTAEQAKQLAAAANKVAECERSLRETMAAGAGRFETWLAKPQAAGDRDLTGYFTFDGDPGSIRNEAASAKGKGIANGLSSVQGIRGRAIQFDGDHGADLPDVFQVDRWNPFTLDFWIRDGARNAKPVVVLQRTFGTDVGYNGFDVMLEDGVLSVRLYRVWPGNAIGTRAKKPIACGEWQHIAVTYDGSSTAAGLKLYSNGRPAEAEVVRDHIHKKAMLPIFGNGHLILGERFRDRGFKDGGFDELRVYDRSLAPVEIANLHDGKALAAALADGAGHRQELEPLYFSSVDDKARKAAHELSEARRQFAEAEDPVLEIPVMEDMPQARATFILARGRYDAPKTDANRVARDTFAKLLIPFPKDSPRNRLGLAQWLTDPHHPLTARVFVNRVWARFFGHGIVTTPENFGQQGALPTHPELLDWLARDFVDHGWDIKRLCRTIALSATYRQDSRCEPEMRERDPENLLLARGPSHRLSAEQIRDVALAGSGLLERKMGGPPVSPYQPGVDLWRESNTMSPLYHQSTGRDLYRRSLYSVWKRTTPLPNMVAFDAPSREVCTVTRGRTNTPMQALVLLNDVQFVEAARALAASVSKAGTQLPAQIDEAFLRFTGRHPDATERNLLADLYNEQLDLFKDKTQQNSAVFTKVGDSKLDPKLDPGHIAALTVVCQTILNLDATIFER
jgi:hypothetical protein